MLHLIIFAAHWFTSLGRAVAASWPANWVTLVLAWSLAVVAFFFDDELVLPPLLLMHFHGHLASTTSRIGLVVVKLLVAHSIMTTMTISKPTPQLLLRLIRIQLRISRSLRQDCWDWDAAAVAARWNFLFWDYWITHIRMLMHRWVVRCILRAAWARVG